MERRIRMENSTLLDICKRESITDTHTDIQSRDAMPFRNLIFEYKLWNHIVRLQRLQDPLNVIHSYKAVKSRAGQHTGKFQEIAWLPNILVTA